MNRHLLGALLCGASVVALSTANAAGLPARGHYVSGAGSISKASQSLTVKQSSTTGIIDWNRFSIGSKNAVTFNNGSGATLNRVTGGNLSRIAGSLHATGSLYLMNGAGVIVSGTGRVVTGGRFVATSGDISNTAFDDGKRKFVDAKAAVINRGSIIAGGAATLIGNTVAENGAIHAGSVVLLGRDGVVISGGIVARRPSGTGGSVTATGRTIVIGADGEIDASASGAHHDGGTIKIDARHTATIAGTLEADGGWKGSGGFIETSGAHVHIADGTKVSTLASHGETGTWLIDPTDFVIAPSGGDVTGATLSNNLISTDELIRSSGGSGGTNGDIIVDDTIIWSSGHTLTLDAYRNIDVNAAISITGAGNLALIDADQTQVPGTPGVNDGNAGDGDLLFNGGRIAFTNVTNGNNTALKINGQGYALENSIGSLASAIAGNASGFFALADNYDASSDQGGNPCSRAPITTTFTGSFEGLGNTIANLSIDDTGNGGDVGLFAKIGNGTQPGIVRDVGIIDENIRSLFSDTTGGLAGLLETGFISAVYVSGTVSANGSGALTGGLVGENGASGEIARSSSTSTVIGGTADTGGLVGKNENGASITESFAAGTVKDGEDVGGLVGWNGGFITQSYANVTVTQGSVSGGFVGSNNGGSISQSYALGNVVAVGGGIAGGFAGVNKGGTIEAAFSIGYVDSGGGKQGGFVGSFSNGALTNTYWDETTSHQTSDPSKQAVGLTTKALQAELPAGFSNSVWGVIEKTSFPFLKSQFAAGVTPTVISGTLFRDDAGDPIGENQSVGIYSGGTEINALSTYFDGSFYALVASAPAGDGIAVVSGDAISYSDIGALNDLKVFGGAITMDTTASSLSALDTALAKALGNNVFGDMPTAQKLSSATLDAVAIHTDGAFDFDQVLNIKDRQLTIASGGDVTQSAGKIEAGAFEADLSSGDLSLDSATNRLSDPSLNDGVVVDIENGNASLVSARALSIGTFSVQGSASLTTSGSGGNIVFVGAVKVGGNLALNSSGKIGGSDVRSISAGSLSGSSNGNVELDNAQDKILELESFDTNGHFFSLATDTSLKIAGAIDAVGIEIEGGNTTISGALEGTTISLSTGSLTEAPHGKIDAQKLSGFAGGAVSLNGINVIAALGVLKNIKSFTLLDDASLTMKGEMTLMNNISLTTVGKNHDLDIAGSLTAGAVDLASAGTISESGAGRIDAVKFSGSSDGSVSLNGKNLIVDLGNFATDNHGFGLRDGVALTVEGTLGAGSGLVELTATGSGGDIAIDGAVKGGTVTFASTGAVKESSHGAVDADLLNVTAQTGINLRSHHNKIEKVGKDNTESGKNIIKT